MTDSEELEKRNAERLVSEVQADFRRRQEERRAIERSWQLNINFLNGNQYCDINGFGELEQTDGDYFWQERKVFNHIAPTVDTRLSKLAGIRPALAVRAASDNEDDKRAAELSSAILSAAYEDCDLNAAVSAATAWTEACGTAFYKVIWDGDAGNEIGKTYGGASVREGRVKVMAVSPFEIYPDALGEENLYNQPSIIHARAVPAEDIFAAYGVRVNGRDIEDFTPAQFHAEAARKPSCRTLKHGYEVVIERYVRPNSQFPQGRLTIVAGNSLLYEGELPYLNGEDGTRTYPFVKQCCIPATGAFFGTCVVERLIPVQRSYNAVKNRKHEFLNRISMGTLAVEEGSVDTDDLVEEGLVPGKVIVYRQGGTPPQSLTFGSVPQEFCEEEARLEEEFYKISGTSDITQKANSFTSVTSATGLQLLIEQDEARLNVCYEQIKSALKRIGKFILRTYRQFASAVRLVRYSTGNDRFSAVSFKGSDITGDDVVLEAESDVNLTPARRRAALYEMMDRGLFADAEGKMSQAVKCKILDSLGYGIYSAGRDLESLHVQRCSQENTALKEGKEVGIKDYDDDRIHIAEHTAFLLTDSLTPDEEARVNAHLQQHVERARGNDETRASSERARGN